MSQIHQILNSTALRFIRGLESTFIAGISLTFLFLLINCKPANLNATCDPSSNNFFITNLILNSQNCFKISNANSNPLHTLYLADSANGIVYFYDTRSEGILSINGSIQTSLTNPFFMLWNGKHLVINGGNSFQSYLRNSDGTLTLKNSYTAVTIPVLLQGSSQFHSSGKFFYYTVNTGAAVTSFSKLQIDSEGSFSGEINSAQSLQYWYVMGPIHPTGNYFMTFHKLSTVTRIFYPISDLNTGALGAATNNNDVSTTTLYPENGNCVYSLNANYLYCANISNNGNNGTIVQMSVTSTSNSVLAPDSVLVQSVDSYQSPKSVILHPNGNYIYAYGNTNIYAYNVDQVTGIIDPSPISVVPTPGGGSCPTNTNLSRLAIHPRGNMLYAVCVVASSSNQLGAYPIDSLGRLSPPTLTPIANTTNSMNLFFVEGN